MRIHSWLTVAVVAVGLAVGGCGDDGDDGSSGAAARPAESKTVGVVYVTKSAEVQSRASFAFKEAFAPLGWKLVEQDAQGNPQKASAAVTTLANQKVDAIITTAWDPSQIRAGLKAAERADIPVVNAYGEVTPSDWLAGSFTIPEKEFAKIYDKDFFELVPSGEIGVLSSIPFPFGVLRGEQLTEDLKQHPDVKVVANHQVDFTKLNVDATNATESMLDANPDLKGIWADADTFVPPAAAVLKKRGLCGKVKLLAFYGDLANLRALRDGCVQTIEEVPIEAQTWGIVDQIASLLYTGTKLPAALPTDYPFNLDVITVTKENAPKDPSAYVDIEYDYRSYFKKEWAREFGSSS